MQQHGIGIGPFALEIVLRDPGDVADHVGERPAERIDPRLAHVGSDAGQFRRADIDPREFLPGQVVGHRHRHEAGAVDQVAHHLTAAGVVDGQQLGDPVEGGLGIGHFVLGDQQAEIRPVARQLHAEAIDDAAAGRRRQAEVELVVRREGLVAPAFQQLKLHQPTGEGQKAHARETAHQEGPAVERALPLVHFLEEDGGFVQAHPPTLLTELRRTSPQGSE